MARLPTGGVRAGAATWMVGAALLARAVGYRGRGPARPPPQELGAFKGGWRLAPPVGGTGVRPDRAGGFWPHRPQASSRRTSPSPLRGQGDVLLMAGEEMHFFYGPDGFGHHQGSGFDCGQLPAGESGTDDNRPDQVHRAADRQRRLVSVVTSGAPLPGGFFRRRASNPPGGRGGGLDGALPSRRRGLAGGRGGQHVLWARRRRQGAADCARGSERDQGFARGTRPKLCARRGAVGSGLSSRRFRRPPLRSPGADGRTQSALYLPGHGARRRRSGTDPWRAGSTRGTDDVSSSEVQGARGGGMPLSWEFV
jgi:hypothetical protein